MGHCTNMPQPPDFCRPGPNPPWDEFYERGWISESQLLYIQQCQAAGMDVELREFPVHVSEQHARVKPFTRTRITVNITLNYESKPPKNKKNGRSKKDTR